MPLHGCRNCLRYIRQNMDSTVYRTGRNLPLFQKRAFIGEKPQFDGRTADVRAECVANGIGMPITTWSTMFQKVRNEMLQAVLNGSDPATSIAEAQTKLEQEIANAN